MLCEFCGKEGKKGDILKFKERKVFVCEECQSYVVLDGLGLEGGFMVVPVKLPSLERVLKDKLYIRPWVKKAKHKPLLAFYHQGAISYVGKVKKIHLKVNRDGISKFLPVEERWGNKQFYTVYELEYVSELEHPITKNNGPPVQGKILVSFKKFLRAKKIRDLMK